MSEKGTVEDVADENVVNGMQRVWFIVDGDIPFCVTHRTEAYVEETDRYELSVHAVCKRELPRELSYIVGGSFSIVFTIENFTTVTLDGCKELFDYMGCGKDVRLTLTVKDGECQQVDDEVDDGDQDGDDDADGIDGDVSGWERENVKRPTSYVVVGPFVNIEYRVRECLDVWDEETEKRRIKVVASRSQDMFLKLRTGIDTGWKILGLGELEMWFEVTNEPPKELSRVRSGGMLCICVGAEKVKSCN